MKQNSKILDFERLIKSFERVVVCLSGGVDSCVLVAYCAKVLGAENVCAFVGTANYMISSEIDYAKKLCRQLNVKIEFCDVGLGEITMGNPQNRCYLCKKNIFEKACAYANSIGFKFVLDGTNFDDLQQSRLGNIAKDELGVKSPFALTQISKTEIRELAIALGLKMLSQKTSATCLMTRFLVGANVDAKLLNSIELAEQYLRDLGFLLVRVRYYGKYVEIQVAPENVAELLKDDMQISIKEKFKQYGFFDVRVAKNGYDFGCMQKV